MPLVSVTNFSPVVSPVLTEGAQYFEGELDITGNMTVMLNGDLYTVPGDYLLFKYDTFVNGQNKLDTYVTVNWVTGTKPDTVGNVALIDRPSTRQVIARLGSAADNGTQYIAGDLTFTGASYMVLDSSLYGSPGTYILYEVTGNITGEAYLAGRVILNGSFLNPGNPYVVTEGGVKKLMIQLSY